MDLAGDDWDIGCAIVREAMVIKDRDRKDELKAIIGSLSRAIGHEVANQIGRMISA